MKKIVMSLVALVFATSAAFAQEASFKLVDANGDGAVTLNEANNAGFSWTEDQFRLADENSDGFLNEDEFAAATR